MRPSPLVEFLEALAFLLQEVEADTATTDRVAAMSVTQWNQYRTQNILCSRVVVVNFFVHCAFTAFTLATLLISAFVYKIPMEEC